MTRSLISAFLLFSMQANAGGLSAAAKIFSEAKTTAAVQAAIARDIIDLKLLKTEGQTFKISNDQNIGTLAARMGEGTYRSSYGLSHSYTLEILSASRDAKYAEPLETIVTDWGKWMKEQARLDATITNGFEIIPLVDGRSVYKIWITRISGNEEILKKALAYVIQRAGGIDGSFAQGAAGL